MAARMRAGSYVPYYYGGPRRESASPEQPLGPKRTLLVIVVVVGCFAILWPKVFYPMLVNNANNQIKPSPADKTSGCCDVISDVDLDTIKIMSELCSTIMEGKDKKGTEPKDMVAQCRREVLETCGIDISAVLQERVSLGHSTKQILEEVRSLNGSLCLKYNFGVSPWSLGVSHRVHVNIDPSSSIRQERPAHLRPEMVHPAFKERGRAIPQPETTARRPGPPPKIVEGRPGPIPGMRPAMGGHGHIVSPSKQANYGFLGVLMPVYTIGFVVFFTYTIMKLVFKKKPEEYAGSSLYPDVDTDEEFHKEVFKDNSNYYHRPSKDNSKIVVNAVSALLEEVNQELEARKQKINDPAAPTATAAEQDDSKIDGEVPENSEETEIKKEEDGENKKDEEQGSVTVMGMETTASCEGGKKWTRPDSPVLPQPPPAPPKEPSPPPQQIFLECSLPPQSQLLVSDSATETQKEPEDDAPVVLAGKMTLSVISLDSETGTEDSSVSGKKAESPETDRRSSGNTSDEFEKINASDLEDQINSIIEEAEIIAMNDEKKLTLSDELDRLDDEIGRPKVDVLEEIKNQLNLEDDLIKAISTKDPEPVVSLPVTDLIKEFLTEEENALLSENISVSNIEKEVADALKEEIDGKNDEILNDEEKELIAKYQALEDEDQQKLDELLSPESCPINPTSAQFLENEEQALLNENPEPADAPLLDDSPKPGETESPPAQIQIPLDVALPQEEAVPINNEPEIIKAPLKTDVELGPTESEENSEANEVLQEKQEVSEPATSNHANASEEDPTKIDEQCKTTENEAQQAKLDEKNEITQEVRESTEKTDELATSQDSIVDGIKEDTLLQEELLLTEGQGELHKRVIRDVGGEKDDDGQQEVVPSEENEPEPQQTDVLLNQQDDDSNTEEKSSEASPDCTGNRGEAQETETDDRKQSQTSSIEPITPESQSGDEIDFVEQVIEDIEYQDESDGDDLPRDNPNSEIPAEDRLNGIENEESEDDVDDDDVEIEEVIEYVDNTDEEGEEIIEINGNQQERSVENHD